MRRGKLRAVVALTVGMAMCVGLAGVSAATPSANGAAAGAGSAKVPMPPNVVLVLLDDFSNDLVKTMPNTLRLRRDGAYFPNSFVADSLCCTSRSALLTGLYPHNNGVWTNTPAPKGEKQGGWKAFHDNGNGAKTFVNAINERKGRSYRTAFQGKYLNGYAGKQGHPVPPGWTQWNAILGAGYQQWDYKMTTTEVKNGKHVMGKPASYGKADGDYATTVLERRAARYIEDSRREYKERPYFLEIAPYATHSIINGKRAHKGDPMFPPAPRDRPGGKSDGNCGAQDCSKLHARDLPGYNDPTKDNRPRFDSGRYGPHWQSDQPMGDDGAKATKHLRDRARMSQAIDRMVGTIRAKAGPNTYIIVTSDNGFHLGQHRARLGKGTAYDYDVRVPLIVYKKTADKANRLTPGPRSQVVSNIDLAPTIRDLSRTSLGEHRDGISFADALRNPKSTKGPRYAFVEHTRPAAKGKDASRDPDLQKGRGGTSSVPSYVAVRSKDAVLIRYDIRGTGQPAWEYYTYDRSRKDGLVEMTNTYLGARGTDRVKSMKAALNRFTGCDGRECRAARTLP
ncbi:MAG: sulfatase-like hydrolase/transferase [Streptosporangiales bacterium]|nr:sulfatase-like hydrolase/transferase [Streptosporangiales bacterium]